MKDYRVVCGEDREIQRILNTWNEEYILDILFFNSDVHISTILLTREEREEDE